MAEGGDEALTYEREYYIRGIQTVEVSLAVLWDSVNRTDVHLVKWWKNKTEPKLKRLLQQNPNAKLKPWQEDDIARLDPEKWDISVLSYAIRNCPQLPNAKHKDLRECAQQLTGIRNFLFHQRASQISFDDYILKILRTSIEKYKALLTADEEACVKYVKQLESINNYRIRDQEIERWMKVLLSRDREMREDMTDEELIKIHAECVRKAKKDVKQNVIVKQHMENKQHIDQQQSMQGANITNFVTVVNSPMPQTQTRGTAPKTGKHAAGIDTTSTPNAKLKAEKKESVGSPPSPFYSKNPVQILNEHWQKNGFQQPIYMDERVGEQEFTCTVIFEGISYDGPRRNSKNDAKRAAAQIVIDSLSTTTDQ